MSATRDLCTEIIREKFFEQLHQEVPFGLAVAHAKFTEDEGPCLKLYTEILVAKDNHRPIVVGRGGALLKKIAPSAQIGSRASWAVRSFWISVFRRKPGGSATSAS